MNILTKEDFLNRDVTIRMRGLAMLLILVGHIVCSFGEKPFFPFVSNRIATPLGGIGCAIFLFISGYGLYESFLKNGLCQFWTKRFLTLLVPYVIFACLFYVVRPINPLMNETVNEILGSTIWFWDYYWFLKYILIWYILFYLINKFAPERVVLLTLLAATLLFIFINSEYMAEQSYSFAFGVIVSHNKKIILSKWQMNNIWTLAVTCLIVGITALALKQMQCVRDLGQDNIVYRSLELFIKLPIGVFFMTLLHSFKFKGIILPYIGIVAYELYLVQMPYLLTIQSSYLRLLFFLVWISLLTFILYKLDRLVHCCPLKIAKRSLK